MAICPFAYVAGYEQAASRATLAHPICEMALAFSANTVKTYPGQPGVNGHKPSLPARWAPGRPAVVYERPTTAPRSPIAFAKWATIFDISSSDWWACDSEKRRQTPYQSFMQAKSIISIRCSML